MAMFHLEPTQETDLRSGEDPNAQRGFAVSCLAVVCRRVCTAELCFAQHGTRQIAGLPKRSAKCLGQLLTSPFRAVQCELPLCSRGKYEAPGPQVFRSGFLI